MSIFQWDTMNVIGAYQLQYPGRMIEGEIIEVELTSRQKVRVWRAQDGKDYFCHGLTFGGKEAPGGIVSPFGDYVPAILREHYEMISEGQARPGDILIWRGPTATEIVHSAILTDPMMVPGGTQLDYPSRLLTKNGILPEAEMTLDTLVERFYGESYSTYRRVKEE